MKERTNMADKVKNIAQENIIDVDLSVVAKKKFRINGDATKILELNTSDLGIVSRISEAYPKLAKLQEEVLTVGELAEGETTDDAEVMTRIGEQMASVDKQMRDLIDFIFDANVSEVCGSEGSMYDPINGMFRYEHIIETLTGLYETDINNEFNTMKKRVEGKANKYTKKYHK